MFKQRLLTTLVLVPLVLFAIYYGSVWLLGAVVLLLTLAMGWEWLQLIPVNRLMNQLIFIAGLLLLIVASIYGLDYWLTGDLFLWGLIFIAVVLFPASQAAWGHRAVVGGACLVLLPTFAGTMNALYHLNQGRDLLVYLLCLIWGADIGAYLAGKQWGRHKLIPQVSPGKTWEGAAGGMGLAMLVALVGYLYFKPQSAMSWFVIAIVTILISMLGDLFISMLKRRSHLKDTGHLFPGHGGVLDRLDSLIAALPLFYCGLRLGM